LDEINATYNEWLVHTREAERLARRYEALVGTPPRVETVTVPKGLLAEVLEEAAGNLRGMHGEFCISTDKLPNGRHSCDVEKERIDQLRQAAGIGSEG
jgi:hypothetical protein